MPSAYLQRRFHSGERVVARGPLVSICACLVLLASSSSWCWEGLLFVIVVVPGL